MMTDTNTRNTTSQPSSTRSSSLSSISTAEYENYLRLATEHNPALIMELDLQNNIQYISSHWKDVIGTAVPRKGTPVSSIIASNNEADLTIFDVALERMLQQGSVSYTVTFNTYSCTTESQLYHSSSNIDPKTTDVNLGVDASTGTGTDIGIGIGLTIPSLHQSHHNSQSSTKETQDNTSLKVSPYTTTPYYSIGTNTPSPLDDSDNDDDKAREQEQQQEEQEVIEEQVKIIQEEETAIEQQVQHTQESIEKEIGIITLEACGILITNADSPRPSVPTHTMWVLKPYNPGWHSSLSDSYFLPEGFIKRLGFGAAIFSDYLKLLDDEKITDESRVPLPRRELCRVCESFVPAWWLETHSQSCILQHRIESLIQLVHDSLVEQRVLIREFLSDSVRMDELGVAVSEGLYKHMKLCDPLKPQKYSYVMDVLESLEELCDHVIAVNTGDLKCVDHCDDEYFGFASENKSAGGAGGAGSGLGLASTSIPSAGAGDVKYKDRSASVPGYSRGQLTFSSISLKPYEKVPFKADMETLSSSVSSQNPSSTVPPMLCNAVYELSPNTKENILKARAWKIKGTNITFDMEEDDNSPETGLQLLVHDTLQLSRKKISAVIRLDNSLLYASNIRKEVNEYVLQLIKDQLERNRISRAQSGLLSNNSSRISLLTSPALRPRNEGSILFNGSINVSGTEVGDSGINGNTNAIVPGDNNNNNINDTLNDRSTGRLTPINPIARIDSPIFSDAYMRSDRVPSDSEMTRGRSRRMRSVHLYPSNSNDTDVPSSSVIGSERSSSRSITPNSVLVPATIADTLNSVASSSAPGSFIGGGSINNSSRLVGSAIAYPSKSSKVKVGGSSSSSFAVPLRKDSLPLGNNNNNNNNICIIPNNNNNNNINSNSSTNSVFNTGSNPGTTGTVSSTRFYHEKSPMDSPFSMPRDFLTPEQLPTASLSPNQPLSPLLLATNQVKSHVPTIKDYDIIKPISKGAFGSVYLARKKLTGDYFAIKVLRKSDMIAKNQITNVKSERAIMMVQSEKPYVAKLYATFQNKDNLFLVMEYLPGGDLATLLKMMGNLPENWARQYLSEIVVGVDDMHKDGIIHHDLKPDNLLIDLNGHLKLTDFGLSRGGLVRRHKYPTRLPKLSISGMESSAGGSQGSSSRAGSNSSNALVLTPNKPTRKSSLSKNTDTQAASFSSTDVGDPLKSGCIADNFEAEILDFKRTESQVSFSLLDASRSSTPPSGFRSLSTPVSDNKFITAGNPSIDPSSTTSTTNFGASSVNSGGCIHSGQFRNRQNSSLTSVTSNTSDLALFHPSDSKGSKRFFGTPDYLAPETIEGTGKDEQCDWWSVGCILFEMIFGYPPFHADTPDAVFKNILACNIQWPEFSSPEEEQSYISPEAKDLILKLLEPTPENRMGVHGISDFKDHAFFKDIDWDHVYEEEASFVPHVDDPENTDYFDSRGAVLHDLDDDNAESPGASLLRKNCFLTGEYDNDLFDAKSSSSFLLGAGSTSHSSSGNAGVGREPLSVPVSRKQSNSSGADFIPGMSPLHLNRPTDKLSILSVLEGMAGPNDSSSAGGSSGSKGTPVVKSMPLAIPPHMRERRPSKLSDSQTEFGSFYFRNLSALDKANKDTINRLKSEHMSDNPGSLHRRTSSGSIINTSLEGLPAKHKSSRHSLVGTSAVGSPIPKGVARFDVSSVRSASPDRFVLDSQPNIIISRKSSVASNADVSSPGSFMTNTGAFKSPSASVWNDPDSFTTPTSSATKFKSPLSPVIGSLGPLFIRGKNPGKNFIPGHHHSVSLDLSSGEENDRLQAVSRINSIRRRRSSRRSSNDSKSEVNYHMDILLCEPIPIHRYRATRDLEKIGCTVVSAGAADEFVSKASSGVKFDLILTTLRLPNVVVTDIVRLIRQTSGVNSKTPIIATTNYYQEAVNTHLFNDVLEKPIDVGHLRRLVLKYALRKSQDVDNPVFSDTEDIAPP